MACFRLSADTSINLGGTAMNDKTVREAVGVFHDEKSLQDAADELLVKGFDRSSLSLLAGQKAVEAKLGHAYQKVSEIEDSPAVASLAYMGSDSRTEAEGLAVSGLAYVGAMVMAGAVVASGGTIAAALIGAAMAGGAGGMIGAALAKFIDNHHADYLQEQLNHGGLLLWVRTEDAEHEARARQILKKHKAEHVHVHDLPEATYDFDGGLSYDLSFMNRLGL